MTPTPQDAEAVARQALDHCYEGAVERGGYDVSAYCEARDAYREAVERRARAECRAESDDLHEANWDMRNRLALAEAELTRLREMEADLRNPYVVECVRFVAALDAGRVKSVERTNGSGNNLWLCQLTRGDGFAFGPDALTAFRATQDHHTGGDDGQ